MFVLLEESVIDLSSSRSGIGRRSG